MKKYYSIVAVIAIVVISFTAGWVSNDKYYDDEYNYDKLKLYQEYYVHAEELLDTIDKYDDWVDRFDNNGYYKSLSEIQNLK